MKNYVIKILALSMVMFLYSCKKSVKDADDNEYKTIKIGNQVWLNSELRTVHYNNGDPIPSDPKVFANAKKGALSNEGRIFYNWLAVTDSRGISPKGYRVATRADYQELVDYLGGRKKAASSLKYTDGFRAFPTGIVESQYGRNYKDEVWFWSSSNVRNMGIAMRFNYQREIINIDDWPMSLGMCVRCIKE